MCHSTVPYLPKVKVIIYDWVQLIFTKPIMQASLEKKMMCILRMVYPPVEATVMYSV